MNKLLSSTSLEHVDGDINERDESGDSTLVESPEVVSPNFKKGSSCVIL